MVGLGGITPHEHWAKFGGVEAYKSIALSAFPNLFTILGEDEAILIFFFKDVSSIFLGPNSGTGHTSALFSIETHIDLVLKIAGPIIKKRQGDVSVKFEYEKDYCDKQQKDLLNRVWAGCR